MNVHEIQRPKIMIENAEHQMHRVRKIQIADRLGMPKTLKEHPGNRNCNLFTFYEQ